MKSEIILSGIRPTGSLHLGNFLGAVEHFVEFQKKEECACLYFVADWHAMTTDHKPERFLGRPVEVVKDYLAAGLDPMRSIIYTQSSIPELLELTWYLATLQGVQELSNLPTYRAEIEKHPTNNNLAFFSYPILMAADILGPRATLVPVGGDQAIHVRLAGKLAQRFNKEYGEYFPVPRTIERMIKVPGLDGQKMGKSEANNAIDIHASREVIRERYLKLGITDQNRRVANDPGDPYHGCKSVYAVHEMITESESASREIAHLCQHAQIGCVDCKNRLVDSIWKKLRPFQERRATIKDEDVVGLLHEGGKKARQMVKETVEVVRDRMGVRIH